MASFGNVLAPNKLFDLASADRDILQNRALRQDVQRVDDVRALAPEIAAGGQRREAALDQMLAIDPTRGAQVQGALGMREQRAQAVTKDEEDRVNQFSRVLAGMPEEARPAAYQAFVAYQKERGLLRRAPEQYPGHDVISMRARMALTPAERAAEANQTAIQGILGGGGGVTPASTGPRADAGFSPAETPARVLLAEADGQPEDGFRGAAAVMVNRARLTGQPLDRVVTAPNQFEPYGSAEGRARMARFTPEQVARAQQTLAGLQDGSIPDPTGGATHFLNPDLQRRLGRPQPSWAPEGQGQRIGGHVFYSRPGDFQRRAEAGGGAASRYEGAADVAGDGVVPESVTRAVLGADAPAPEAGLGGYAADGTDELTASYAARQAPAQPAPAVDIPEVAVTAEAPLPVPPPQAPDPRQAQAPRPAARVPLAGLSRPNALLGDNSADRLNEISYNLARGNLVADSPEARNIDRAMGTGRFRDVASPDAMPAMGTITRENLPDITPAVRVAPSGARQNALLPPVQPVVPFSQSQVSAQPAEAPARRIEPAEVTPAAEGTRPAAAAPNMDGMRAQADDLRSKALRLAALGNPQATAAANTLTAQAEAIERRMRDERDYSTRREDRSLAERRHEETTRLQQDAARRADAAAQRQQEAADRAARAAEDKARRESGPEGATEAERKAAGYMERMRGAEAMLEDMVRQGYDPGNTRDRIAQATPFVGNFLVTEQGQRYLNAAAEWARAKLRLESGAAIGENEAREEAKTYFPMPGDDAATVEQKRRLRETAVAGIRTQAGRAVPRGDASPRTSEVSTPRGNDATSAERPPLSAFERP